LYANSTLTHREKGVEVSLTEFGPFFDPLADLGELLLYPSAHLHLRLRKLTFGDFVKKASIHGHENRNLLCRREGLVLRLFEDFPDAPAAFKSLFGLVIQASPET
jgi:hypothetical protein